MSAVVPSLSCVLTAAEVLVSRVETTSVWPSEEAAMSAVIPSSLAAFTSNSAWRSTSALTTSAWPLCAAWMSTVTLWSSTWLRSAPLATSSAANLVFSTTMESQSRLCAFWSSSTYTSFGSAPPSTKASATSPKLPATAFRRGVASSSSFTRGSARPLSSSSFTTSRWPPRAATWSAVTPSLCGSTSSLPLAIASATCTR
mmetsp:Transcript_68764/g.155520  ORF Transcript_68764/g.155520 Transcript_68764/m.155520 type:complete len:200 (+) Transcript_68764:534-1133(+)